jgi:hypothetical protein
VPELAAGSLVPLALRELTARPVRSLPVTQRPPLPEPTRVRQAPHQQSSQPPLSSLSSSLAAAAHSPAFP